LGNGEFLTQLAQILHQVVGKTVVVIDNDDHNNRADLALKNAMELSGLHHLPERGDQ
jgi:hypothetical protein